MKFITIAAVLALATVVAGSPVALSTSTSSTDSLAGPIEKRSPSVSGLYACTGEDFGGQCEYLASPYNQCSDFDTKLAKHINSVGPEHGSSCSFYVSKGCAGPSLQGGISNMVNVQYPGYATLKNLNFADRFLSYRCTAVPWKYMGGQHGS